MALKAPFQTHIVPETSKTLKMSGKFHFRFPFLLILSLLLFFISFVRSEDRIEVNLQLQLSVNCSTNISDPCSYPQSECNSDGKCQCRFRYTPITSGLSCEEFNCALPNDCKQLYKDVNATCDYGRCSCASGMWTGSDNKCKHYDKPTVRLGGHCVADHQCGYHAQCSLAGECRCPAGYIPESDFTCAHPQCSSDEFCHKYVTPNTTCEDKECKCNPPFLQQNNETFACVRILPAIIKLGAHCGNSTGSHCGEGAGCTNETSGSDLQICKCRLGYEATSDTVCEVVHCGRDEYCHKHVSPLTTCFHKGDKVESYCGCKDGFYENPETFTCWAKADNVGDQHGGD